MPEDASEPGDRFEHAKRRLSDAESLFEEGFWESAIHAAYYAIFHAAMAALALQDSHPRTHRGTHSEFNRLLVQTDLVDPEAASLMQEVWDARLEADYGIVSTWNEDEVEEIVGAAVHFIELVEPHVEETAGA